MFDICLTSHFTRSAASSPAEGLGYEETTCDAKNRDGEQTGIIVHGLLGSARNWRGFSRELAKSFADRSGRFEAIF